MAVWVAAVALAGCGADRGPAPADSTAPPAQASPAEPPEAAEPPKPVEADWPAGELRTGGELEAELDRGETHVYRLPLEAGQFLRVRVEQDGVDVELFLEDPQGQLLLDAPCDRLINEFGPELVMAVVERSGVHSLVLRAFPSHGPGRYQARIVALRPASEKDRRAAATYRRFVEAEAFARQSRERAAAVWADALATWRELDEPALEAEVLARMARDHFDFGEWAPSEARYREALAIFSRVGERRWELVLHHNLASLLAYQLEYDEAIEEFRTAAELARQAGDRRVEASAFYGLGTAYRARGEVQPALSHFEAALDLVAQDDFNTRPLVLHDLATLYWHYFQDPARARELFLEARDLYRPAEIYTHPSWKARTLNQLGLLAHEQGHLEEARRDLEEALAVPSGFDRCGRSTALASLALVEEQDGERDAADARMAEAFETAAAGSCAASQAAIQLFAGKLAEQRSAPGEALAAYRRSRELAAEQGDRGRLVESLAAIARAQRALGRLPEALEASREALAIVEEVRPTVLREDLRTAFFATAQDTFDLHIGLLLAQGAEADAWAAAERARAQALRDLLAEAGTGPRLHADPALVAKERDLRRRLNVLESRREKAARAGAGSLTARHRDVDALIEEIERVRGEIRRGSPAYAALTATLPLSLPSVQRDLLDPDTLVLEYRLGTEASWLWAITRDSFATFRLPPRDEIERVAREATRWAQSLQWPGHSPRPLCELARSILGPVAPLLGNRRLVVVPDGALEAVPFAALPEPSALCPEAPPLIAAHELVQIPSVAALAAQRRLLAHRAPAPGWLAMVADPVYGPDDERLRGAAGPRPASLAPAPAGRFTRLRYSGEEAAAVLAELPGGRTFTATGTDASKATVIGGSISGHRIVHFATHGVLNPRQPLLSYLALSERTDDGSPVDGALYAHEIYDLDVPAELVVLSACETALGREVRGEGLVSGLPRAFLYAGAERVLVSLWPVQDRSTRDLMARFYRGLVDGGLPPGRALQEAQRSLWRAGRPPVQWAGFVLEGDWRPLPPFDP